MKKQLLLMMLFSTFCVGIIKAAVKKPSLWEKTKASASGTAKKISGTDDASLEKKGKDLLAKIKKNPNQKDYESLIKLQKQSSSNATARKFDNLINEARKIMEEQVQKKEGTKEYKRGRESTQQAEGQARTQQEVKIDRPIQDEIDQFEKDSKRLTRDELKKEYNRLARKYHPDKAPTGKEAMHEAAFKKIVAIWEPFK